MRIGYVSDLHLEFRDNDFILKCLLYFNVVGKEVDFLVFAGDVHSDKKKRKKFFEQLTVPYKTVMGNHDWFKTEVTDDFFDEDGIVGACLWTNFDNNPLTELSARRQIWDFAYIPNWTTEKCKSMFESQIERIMESDSQIVVTHFAPSHGSVTPMFKGDPLNGYFCNNLDHLIANSNKKFWIHGHVHSDHDYMIGGCRVVANPWGYPDELRKQQVVRFLEI